MTMTRVALKLPSAFFVPSATIIDPVLTSDREPVEDAFGPGAVENTVGDEVSTCTVEPFRALTVIVDPDTAVTVPPTRGSWMPTADAARLVWFASIVPVATTCSPVAMALVVDDWPPRVTVVLDDTSTVRQKPWPSATVTVVSLTDTTVPRI